jgi:threonine dehydratase
VPTPSDLEPAAIRAIAPTIDPVFVGSPQFVHDGLSARLGQPVIVKVETVNPVRSLKGRGTWVAVRALAADGAIGPGRAVVCASAGNFGQGLAYAARGLGVPAVVFASRRANRAKIERMQALGADVVEAGDDFDAAREAAADRAADGGGHLLVDGDDDRIAAGAATIGLEVTDAIAAGVLPELGAASIPVGNGALIIGVGSWLRAAAPACRVVGIQAAGAPAMTLSWRAGRPVDTNEAATYADGIAARVAIPRAVELMADRVDAMLLVDDDALRAAQSELTAALGITVEGAAAASWAGLLAGPPPDGAALLVVNGSTV